MKDKHKLQGFFWAFLGLLLGGISIYAGFVDKNEILFASGFATLFTFAAIQLVANCHHALIANHEVLKDIRNLLDKK